MKKPLMGVIAGGVLLIGGMTVVGTVLSAPSCIDDQTKKISERIEFCPVSGKQRALFKSQEIGKINLVSTYTDSRGQTIEITANPVAINVAGQNGVELFARAWRNGKQLGFGADGTVEIERFRIFNPPIMVDDPNGKVVRSWTKTETATGSTSPQQRKLREDPAEAIRQVLSHNIFLVGKENTAVIVGKIGKTTSTFYPDAGKPGSTSVDGELSSFDASYSTVHDAATGLQVDRDGTSLIEIGNEKFGATYYIFRSLTNFDTSPITDTDTLNSATLSLFESSGNTSSTADSDSVSLITNSITSNTDYVLGDYGSFGTTKQATDIAIGSLADGAYNDFALNATGLGNISVTGVSKFGIRSAKDVSNTAPTGKNEAFFYSADTAGTANDPQLVVVTTAVSSAPPAPDDGFFLFE